MGAAALPAGTRQRGADRRHQAAVGVGDDQAYSGQPAGGQRAQEGQPAGAVFVRGDLQAEDFSAAVSVDTNRDQSVDIDRAAVFTDLDDQGVDPDERVGAGIQRPVTECLDLRVQVPGHLRHLALGQLFDAELLDQLFHSPGRDAKQITRRDHGHEGLFSATTVLQQPVREVTALPQLGDRQLDTARPGIPIPVPVAVTRVDPLVAALAVPGPAQRISLGRHQHVGEGLHHRPQQIRARRLQMLAQQPSDVQTLFCGHRRFSFVI